MQPQAVGSQGGTFTAVNGGNFWSQLPRQLAFMKEGHEMFSVQEEETGGDADASGIKARTATGLAALIVVTVQISQ